MNDEMTRWRKTQKSIQERCDINLNAYIKVFKENGKDVFFYRVYRGSHDYNTMEMSQLIKGTIEECKAQEISVATPDEIAHMQSLWEARYKKMCDRKV